MILTVIFLLFPALFSAKTLPRIIGGQPANATSFPYVAAIYKTTANGPFFCGGTLIETQWILTAGQCVDGAVSFNIRLGSNLLSSTDYVNLTSETYVLHPDFNATTLENDLGLIKLDEPLNITDFLKPIPFLSGEYLLPNHTNIALGWGQTGDDSTDLADNLQYVELTAILNDECKVTYGTQITENMVCMVGTSNEGACQGDTGGPLVENIVRDTDWYMLVGIASFVSGNGCESTDPSGYTRIDPYTYWIYTVTHS